MSVSYKAIGRNLRTARESNGLTQAQMAERLGMSTLHYGRLERGTRSISLDQIAAISVTLQVPVIKLLHGMSTEAILTPFPVQSGRIGTIIDFLSAGCSDRARSLMLDVCTLIARHDKY